MVDKDKFRDISITYRQSRSRTSERRSSTEEAENVGTRSDPLIIVVMKCLPDSAKSQVIQAAAGCSIKVQCKALQQSELTDI